MDLFLRVMPLHAMVRLDFKLLNLYLEMLLCLNLIVCFHLLQLLG